jgi:choline kinase
MKTAPELKAVILAAGQGSRLRELGPSKPLTLDKPAEVQRRKDEVKALIRHGLGATPDRSRPRRIR